MRTPLILLFLLFSSGFYLNAQHIYYKHPDSSIVSRFSDSTGRLRFCGGDSNVILVKQMAYLLKFYPHMLLKRIDLKYKKSSSTIRVKPTFRSVFKAPEQRVYKMILSKGTGSTLDSVLIHNLGFNAQLGLLSVQLSQIEDLSAGGFFNFLYWGGRQFSHKGLRKIYRDAELKSLELGMGYQLLAYNTEFLERLKIENWQSTKGYRYYMEHYRNFLMKPAMIENFLGDLPVYMSHSYK
ncbi:MAG TPA: hypothetical protein PLQ93_04085 [Bacteroidia bacterium]|nr:hypothetical protein [Bacteroidia bacterium]